jgi:hypothetical protein
MRFAMSREEDPTRPKTLRPMSVATASSEVDSTRDPFGRSTSSGSGARKMGENLAPLIQFLHKNIGRPWKDVHAEICKVVAPGSVAQRQVLDNVSGLVATAVVVMDGKPYRSLEGGLERSKVRPLTGSKWDSLYVCPTTGILRTVERAAEPLRRHNPDVRPIGPLSQYRRMNGTWYLVELAFIPSIVSAFGDHYDVLLHAPLADISSEELRKMYGSYDRYAVSKRPLGKRELLRLADVLGSI